MCHGIAICILVQKSCCTAMLVNKITRKSICLKSSILLENGPGSLGNSRAKLVSFCAVDLSLETDRVCHILHCLVLEPWLGWQRTEKRTDISTEKLGSVGAHSLGWHSSNCATTQPGTSACFFRSAQGKGLALLRRGSLWRRSLRLQTSWRRKLQLLAFAHRDHTCLNTHT